MAVGSAVSAWGTVTPNASIAGAADLDGPHLVSFFAKVGLQLIGEELITILPFLALLSLYYAIFGLGRSAAVLLAWLASAIGFGLIHLPTYDWNVVQCVVIIGSARLVLTWAYIWSKNIWVSTGAHVINDWALIAMPLVLAPLVVNS
jgi:membrane protease YdiL (CAAX protease family)